MAATNKRSAHRRTDRQADKVRQTNVQTESTPKNKQNKFQYLKVVVMFSFHFSSNFKFGIS